MVDHRDGCEVVQVSVYWQESPGSTAESHVFSFPRRECPVAGSAMNSAYFTFPFRRMTYIKSSLGRACWRYLKERRMEPDQGLISRDERPSDEPVRVVTSC